MRSLFRVGTALGAAGLAATLGIAVMAAAPAVPADVNFTKHIAPILQRKCQACHQPGSIAPMSLLTYGDAVDNADAIKQKVSQRLMPPWHIDKTVGIQAFKNDRSLTDAQIESIVHWVDDGAPMGNEADMT